MEATCDATKGSIGVRSVEVPATSITKAVPNFLPGRDLRCKGEAHMKVVQIEGALNCLYALDSEGNIYCMHNMTGWSEIQNPVEPTRRHPRTDDTEPEGFPEFYSIYPRKDGRREAARAFRGALKRHPDYGPSDLESAAELFAEACKTKEKEYIPFPATWLNQDRFREFFDE
jgi:hypothetical protein